MSIAINVFTKDSLVERVLVVKASGDVGLFDLPLNKKRSRLSTIFTGWGTPYRLAYIASNGITSLKASKILTPCVRTIKANGTN